MFCLVIIFTVLDVHAILDINDTHDKLIIDLSDGYFEGGYYYLPVADNVSKNYYVGMYKTGYILSDQGKENNNLFIEFGCRMIPDSDIYKKMIKIKYRPEVIMFNGTIVYTEINFLQDNTYNVPVIYNGERVTLEVYCCNDRKGCKITGAINAENEKIVIQKGDKIIPIYEYRNIGEENYFEIEELICDYIQLDEIIYDDTLEITKGYYNKDNYAVKLELVDKQNKFTVSQPIMLIHNIVPEKTTINDQDAFEKSTPSTWAENEIKAAVSYGIITENVIDNYQGLITREEFCELAVRFYEELSKSTTEAVSPNPFTDTNNQQVLKAFSLDIAKGTGNGLFEPKQYIKREQLAVMLYNTVCAAIPEKLDIDHELQFSDKGEISNWAINALKFMNKYEFMVGSSNTISPKNNTTKEQAIIVTVRLFEYFNKIMNGSVFEY